MLFLIKYAFTENCFIHITQYNMSAMRLEEIRGKMITFFWKKKVFISEIKKEKKENRRKKTFYTIMPINVSG